jgi:hypothetical protein
MGDSEGCEIRPLIGLARAQPEAVAGEGRRVALVVAIEDVERLKASAEPVSSPSEKAEGKRMMALRGKAPNRRGQESAQ